MAKGEDEPASRSLSYAYGAVMRDGVSVGTAFLVDRALALTCAHVAYHAATGRRDWQGAPRPRERIQLRFPQCQGRPVVEVEIAEWFPAPDDDFAVLQLPEDGVPGTLVAPVSIDAGEGEAVRILGFPKGAWYGVPLQGKVTGTGARLITAIDEASLIGVTPGFSGAPVWSDRRSAVIGMVSTVAQEAPRLAAATPLSAMLSRLQTVRADAGVSSRVRMAFEAPRNEQRCEAIKRGLPKAIAAMKWPQASAPDTFDVVEVAEEGDLEVPWTSCWSASHPLNAKFPKDGDLFFTISLRATGRRSPRNICEVAVVWSGRGVSFAFGDTVSQPEARSYLIQELEAQLNAEKATGFVVQPSDWYGVELAALEFLDGEPEEAFIARLAELMSEMSFIFQRLLDRVEADLGVSLAKRPPPRRKRDKAKPAGSSKPLIETSSRNDRP